MITVKEVMKPTSAKKEKDLREEGMKMPIDQCGFPSRLEWGLAKGGYDTLGDLIGKSESEVFRLPGVGRKSLQDVHEKLACYGLSLHGGRDSDMRIKDVEKLMQIMKKYSSTGKKLLIQLLKHTIESTEVV